MTPCPHLFITPHGFWHRLNPASSNLPFVNRFEPVGFLADAVEADRLQRRPDEDLSPDEQAASISSAGNTRATGQLRDTIIVNS